MNAKKLRYSLIVLLAVLTAFSVIGCGSGGGGGGGGDSTPAAQTPTVSGVAATGAAMSGTVSLKDSSNPVVTLGPVNINPDGSFTFNVTGLTPPFYLCATDNGGNKLYSVAMDAGLANINPFTNLIIAFAAGVTDPADVYNGTAGKSIDQNSIDQALNDLRNMLMALLNKYGVSNVNPFTDPFTVGAGLDLLFDDVGISINTVTGVVTFTDKTGSNPLVIEVSGNGFNEPDPNSPGFRATLSIDTSTSQLSYIFRQMIFIGKTITDVSVIVGGATITGDGEVNGVPGYTFTVTILDGSPDAMGIVINSGGSIYYSASPQDTSDGGVGFATVIN